MSCSKSLSLAMLLASMVGSQLLFAQGAKPGPKAGTDASDKPPARSREPASPAAGMTVNDHSLATCAVIDNQAVIAMANFAKSQSKNDEIQKFAGEMVAGHQSILEQLERFAPEAVRNESLMRDDELAAGNDTGTRLLGGILPGSSVEKTAGTAAPSNPASAPLSFVDLHRELVTQCLVDSKRELKQQSATEFDSSFIASQIVSHSAMHSKLVVLQRHATPDLATVFKNAASSVRSHQLKAEKILESLSSANSVGTKDSGQLRQPAGTAPAGR